MQIVTIQNINCGAIFFKPGTCNSHWNRWHKVTLRALLCITRHFHIFYSDMQLKKHTQGIVLLRTANDYTNSPHYHFLHSLSIPSKLFTNTSQRRHYLREQGNSNFYNYFVNIAVLYVVLEIDKFITCGLKLFYVSGTRVIMKAIRLISRAHNNLLSLPIYQVLITTLLRVMDTRPRITASEFQPKCISSRFSIFRFRNSP